MRFISPNELQNELNSSDQFVVLDIREPYELAICAIEALHIPMAEIPQRYTEIDKNKTIVVMCRGGNRAEATANLMECELGFDNIYVLKGGILNWIAEIDSQLESY